MPTNSWSDFSSARSVGTPISPVPINKMRIKVRLRSRPPYWAAALRPGPRRLHQHAFAGRDFALADRRRAFSAQIVEYFLVRENQEQPFPHRHRRFAFLAIKTGSGKILKLLLRCAHAVRSRH